jgi:hypothetical protein
MSVQQAMDLPIELILIGLFLAMIAIALVAIFVFRARGNYVAKDSALWIFPWLASGPANAQKTQNAPGDGVRADCALMTS